MCRALRYMNWRYLATYRRLILHYLWFQGTLHFARWLINKDVPFLSIDISRMLHKLTLSRVYGSCIVTVKVLAPYFIRGFFLGIGGPTSAYAGLPD